MRIWLTLSIVFISSSSVFADSLKLTVPVNLKHVIVNVLENNPQLIANDFESRAAAAKIRQARLSKPYNLKMELENFAGSNNYNAFDAVETTLSLTKILELGNKPILRGKVAQHEATILQNEKDVNRLDLLSEAARRFIHMAVDQERLILANDKLALIKRTRNIVHKRVRLGRSPKTDNRRLTIELARAEIEHEHAEHELLTSRLKLSSLWGDTEPDPFVVISSLFKLEPVASFRQLASLLDKNPDLIRYASSQRLAEARLNLSRSQSQPDIDLSAGVRYFNESNDGAFMFTATIPLGMRKQSISNVEQAGLMSKREPFLLEQRRLELYTNLYEFYQELKHARSSVISLRESIIPEAKLVLADYEKGFEVGRYSLLELTEAQRSLLTARLELVMAAAKYHRTRIEIERLTGTEMNTEVKP